MLLKLLKILSEPGSNSNTDLLMLCYLGNYTEDSLQRIAKSTAMSKILEETLLPHYKERQYILRIRLMLNTELLVTR